MRLHTTRREEEQEEEWMRDEARIDWLNVKRWSSFRLDGVVVGVYLAVCLAVVIVQIIQVH